VGATETDSVAGVVPLVGATESQLPVLDAAAVKATAAPPVALTWIDCEAGRVPPVW
jgi:hypothetical protein